MNEYAKYQFFLSLFNSALCVASFAYTWWATRNKAVQVRFEDQDGKIAAQAREIAALQTKLGNLPGHCNGHGQLSAKQDAQGEKQAQFEKLLTAVETDLKHLPTVRDIEKLYENLNNVRNEVSSLAKEVSKVAGAMPGVTHVTEMMNEFLLHHGGK